MSTLEDRLRATALAVTEVIPEGSAPPLRLAEPRSRHSGAGQRGRRRWAEQMAPLAAAAAVVLVTAVSVAMAHQWFGSRGARTGPDGTPPYYISLASYASPHSGSAADATVRSTATGSVLARIAPPRFYSGFTVVTGAADDNTFVLGAERAAPGIAFTPVPPTAGNTLWVNSPPAQASVFTTEVASNVYALNSVVTQFFALRLGASASSPRLTRLDIGPETQPVAAAALSPDGRKLAVALAPPGRLQIQVVDLVTHASRVWQGSTWARFWPKQQSDLANDSSAIVLSWAADDRTLAVDWPGPSALHGDYSIPYSIPLMLSVSVLDTEAPGNDLAQDSAAVTPSGYLVGYSGNAILTPDASAIVASGLLRSGTDAAIRGLVNWRTAVTEYSARTGAVLQQFPLPLPQLDLLGPVPRVLWSNDTGSVLIISAAVYRYQSLASYGHDSTIIGVLTKGKFTELPGLRAPLTSVRADPGGIAW